MSLLKFSEKYLIDPTRVSKPFSIDHITRSSRYTADKDPRSFLEPAWISACFSSAWAIVLGNHLLDDVVRFEIPNISTPRGAERAQSSNTTNHIKNKEYLTLVELVIPSPDTQIAEFTQYVFEVITRQMNQANAHPKDGIYESPSSCLSLRGQDFSSNSSELDSVSRELVIRPNITEDGSIHFKCYFSSGIPRYFVDILLSHLDETVNSILHVHCKATNSSEHGKSPCLKDISLASPKEAQTIDEFSKPIRSLHDIPAGSIHQKFRLQALSTPNKAAIENHKHETFSYRCVDVMSDILAEHLHKKAINDGYREEATSSERERVVAGLLFGRSVDVVIAMLAVWKAGMAFCILEPDQPLTRIRAMIETAQCSFVLTNTETGISYDRTWAYDFAQLHANSIEHMNFSEAAVQCRSQDLDMKQYYHDLAYIQFTSGSTGRPKGVLHSHATSGTFVCSFEPIPDHKSLLFLSPSASASQIPIWTTLISGGCLTIVPKDMLVDMEGCINSFNITELVITPGALALISPSRVSSLESIIVLGEKLTNEDVSPWLPSTKVRPIYGSSEICSPLWPTLNEKNDIIPAYSKPFTDMSMDVYFPDREDPCPFYVPGELCVTATYTSEGYLGADETSKSRFVSNPRAALTGHPRMYRTGDLVMLTHDNKIVIIGRLDQQVKINGNRVETAEIEHLLLTIPGIKDARVFLVKVETGMDILVGALVPNRKEQSTGQSIKDWLHEKASSLCQNNLPAYMCPSRWAVFDELPKTISGKIDLKETECQIKDQISEDHLQSHNSLPDDEFGSSRSEEIDRLSEVCEEVIFGSHVHRSHKLLSQSFLHLGGSSLSAMKVIRELAQRGLRLGLKELLEASSLHEAAASISRIDRHVETSKLTTNGTAKGHQQYELPTNLGIQNSEIKAVYPTSVFQSQIFLTTILNPRTWCLYRCFDFSDFTKDEVQTGLQALVNSKDILRTCFVPVKEDIPCSNRGVNNKFGLTSQNFVQVVRHHLEVKLESVPEVKTGHDFYAYDIQQGWTIGGLLWKAVWIEDKHYLGWNIHNGLVDQWSEAFLFDDLVSTMEGIRAARNGGDVKILEAAKEKARRLAMQDWVEEMFANKGIGGELGQTTQQYQELWKSYLWGCEGTYLDDANIMSVQDLEVPPPDPYIMPVEIPYKEFCLRNGITSGAILQATWTLTLAQLVPEFPKEVSFYRLGSNRDSHPEAMDIEGALVSLSPIRMLLDPDWTLLHLVRHCMETYLSLRTAEPYYIESYQPGGYLGSQRAYGNTLLNHIVLQPEDSKRPYHQLKDTIAETEGMAGATMFMVTSLSVVEIDPVEALEFELSLCTDLAEEQAWTILKIFRQNLRAIIEGGGDKRINDIMPR